MLSGVGFGLLPVLVRFNARGAPGKSLMGLLLTSRITKPSYIRDSVLELLDQSFEGRAIIKT